jgi:hypothetical protein
LWPPFNAIEVGIPPRFRERCIAAHFVAQKGRWGGPKPQWKEPLLAQRGLPEESGQFRSLVSYENGNQFGRLSVACIGGNQMRRAGRFKERLPNRECFQRAALELRADLALCDVGCDGATMAVRRRESSGTVTHTDYS